VFGDKEFPGVGYPTPVSIPETTTWLTLNIPASDGWWAVTVGLLCSLMLEWNWQQFEDGLDRDVVTARWQQMLEDALEVASTTNSCPAPADVGTPYWDDVVEVDDNADPETQIWYGEVDDPTVVPTEATFRETLENYTFAGLLAIAGAPGAAIAFLTIAPKFRLAFKQGDIGKIIRIFVDASEVAEIEQDGSGDLIEVDVVADPDLETHQIYVTVGDA